MNKREQPGLDGHHRDGRSKEIRSKRADTMILGLRAFEKISAVEGISLTDQMRRDARALSDKRMRDFFNQMKTITRTPS